VRDNAHYHFSLCVLFFGEMKTLVVNRVQTLITPKIISVAAVQHSATMIKI
jgi:hypothetical protein